jgi:hypothetical protein
VNGRQAFERQRQDAGLGSAKTCCVDVRQTVRRNDGDEERGEREQLYGDRGEKGDQRAIKGAEGTIGGE